jgi:hypothetical protein
MSIFQRLALVGVAAAGIAGFTSSAEAQYYQQSPYGYYQQPAPQYVHPKILRKQREMEQRVYQKYGYPQQRHRNSYDYGYQQPQYYPQPRYQQPQYQQPRYQQVYPQQYYQQGAPSYRQQGIPNGSLQLRQGQSYVE